MKGELQGGGEGEGRQEERESGRRVRNTVYT